MSDHSQPPALPPRGILGDIHRARTGASASAKELQEFVAQLRGRSPQEMLGMIAGSDLVRATTLATVITVVFMAAFTVGPYLLNKREKEKAAAVPVVAPTAPAPNAVAPAPQSTAPSSAAVAGPAGSAPGGAVPPGGLPPAGRPGASGPRDPLAPSGVNETKTADPNKNPLENRTDDLLKDIGK
jgi:hypothetical protein